jgi:uncharacterized protein YybS (DUF2232 family)
MYAMYGDGIGPDGFADPAPPGPVTRIVVTLTPRTESVEDLEIQHSKNVDHRDVADVLETVVEILRAPGPGVIVATGVIFGGIEHG